MKNKKEQVEDFMQKFFDKELTKKIVVSQMLNKTFSDIGLNSISLVELLTLAEKKFHILIEGSELPKKETLESYIDLIYRKTK